MFSSVTPEKNRFLIRTGFMTIRKINNKKIFNSVLVCSLSVSRVENFKVIRHCFFDLELAKKNLLQMELKGSKSRKTPLIFVRKKVFKLHVFFGESIISEFFWQVSDV